MPAKLGTIVLTRTPELFGRLLSSAQGMPLGDLCVVVNNGLSPEVTEAGIRARWAVINPPRNLSFSAGNNLAADVAIKAGCSHLLLLNDDVIASPRFFDGVRASLDLAEPLVGFRLTDRGRVNHDGTKVFRTTATDHIGRDAPVSSREPKVAIVPAVTFAAAAVTSQAWTALGGLDEGYFYGWEDSDFCLRVLESGGIIRVNRAVDAEHAECGTRMRGSQINSENATRFLNRWRERLPGILDGYKERYPDAEGIDE